MSAQPLFTYSPSNFQLGQSNPVLPERIGLSLPDKSTGVVAGIQPFLVIGRRTSLRDRDVQVDLGPLNAASLKVSRFHLMLLSIDYRVTIKDLHSLHGTFLNDKRLVPDQEYILRHRDHLRLGDLELLVYFTGVLKA